MHRRVIAMAMASGLCFPAAALVHAAPLPGFHHSAGENASTGKMISFNVRNDTKSTLVIKAGDQQFTIEPGKTAAMKLQEGADLITVNGTDSRPAGSVLTKVMKQLQGNTLAVS